MLRVAVVGSINLDLVATAERLPAPGETVPGLDYHEFPGGKGLNQAVAAARAGAAVVLVGAVGDDDAGASLLEVAAAEGIGTGAIASVAGSPTGRALITVDRRGENCIVVVPGANAAVRWDRGPSPAADVLLAQLEIPVETVVAAFAAGRAAGATNVLNPAPAVPIPDALLVSTDVVVPNEHEAEHLGGVDTLLARGPRAVVVTRGGAGVTVHERERTWHEPAVAVEPVDTTGAGDAFCGALAARLAAGDGLPAAVRWASAAGALATTVAGAVPSLPSADRVRALLAGRR